MGGSVFSAEICSYMNITTGWDCFQSVLIKVSGQLPISLGDQETFKLPEEDGDRTGCCGGRCFTWNRVYRLAMAAFLHGIGLLV